MFNKLANKDIDLLQAYNRKSGPSPHEVLLKVAVPPLCIVLIYTCIFAWQKVDTLADKRNISTLDKEITKYQNKIQDLGDKEQNEYLSYQEKNSKIDSVIKALNTYPLLNSLPINIFSNILPAGMNIESISYENGTFTTSLNTQSVLSIEEYVRTLRSSDIFDSVKYAGYQQEEKVLNNSTDKEESSAITMKYYIFQVICTLKGGE